MMRLSLGYQVLVAVVLGIFCGFFFGPLCNIVKPVGNVYVMLLQMVALPYICFSLIHGLGSMSRDVGKKLFMKGWVFWLVLWALMFLLIYLASLLIPKPGVSFIGNVSVDRDSSLAKNFLSYLVPENPFYDMANNVVPAIAVFGLIAGVALMALEKKEPLLSIFERTNQVIEQILQWLAILSPIGVFSHIAVATGTVHFEDLYAINFYVVCFILMTLFVTLWVLPVLLAGLTPMTYTEVLKAFKTVCLLPFATGLPSISLPFIASFLRKAGQKYAPDDPLFHSTSQTAMPFCYSFGQIGNGMILFFILFLSFFYRHPFVGSEITLLTILTIPMSIGTSATSINAVSFLIEQLNFPDESIELFTETLAVTLNFQVLLSIASVLTFIILVLFSFYGRLEIKWRQLALRLSAAFVCFGAILFATKQIVHLRDNYTNLYMQLHVEEVIPDPVAFKMLAEGDAGTVRNTADAPNNRPLADILRSGVLKVGYDPEEIPYCYWNTRQQLAGYDVSYAFQLARDLDCTLEFVPMNIDRLSEEISTGKYDIGMAAIIMNEERIRTMDFTHPYTEQDNVLIVPLKKRSQYTRLERVVSMAGLKIGAIGGYASVVERHFPLARVYVAPQGTDIEKALLSGEADVWAWSHTHAFIWCLSHPEFVVADYGGLIGKRYFAYPILTGAVDWASFLNNWLVLKEQSGFKTRMQRYWIDGESPRERPPRWSVVRNVLHWIQ